LALLQEGAGVMLTYRAGKHVSNLVPFFLLKLSSRKINKNPVVTLQRAATAVSQHQQCRSTNSAAAPASQCAATVMLQ